MKKPIPASLLYSLRENLIDEEYFGYLFLFEKDKRKFAFGNDFNSHFWLRSMSKPVQASTMADFDTVSYFNFNQEEVAIMCGSHAGTFEHVKVVRNILSKIGLDETALKCGVVEPLDKKDYDGVSKRIYNNCSAKHAMMLALCKQLGFNIENYLDISHPVQKLMKEKHLELSCAKSLVVSKDGCGAPVFALPFDNISKMFFNLFNDEKYDFIKNAPLKFPYIFGGNNRLDTKIIEIGKGKLFSKVGANGFVFIYNLETNENLIVKMCQNNNFAREAIVFFALSELNWTDENPFDYNIYNQLGEFVAKYYKNFSFS